MAAETPPNDCHTYVDEDEVPEQIKKYWVQRHDLFSRYDNGIWLTDDAWFGVTPEPIASAIAKDVGASAPANKTVVIDAFAGVGGNTIAFALSGRWERVFAIEKDASVLACAKHNAKVYGVDKKIWWIHGDCFDKIGKQLSSVMPNAVIFASPPWGGPGYRSEDVFDLETMQPYSLVQLHQAFQKAKASVLYLPRTSNVQQLAGLNDVSLPVQASYNANQALCAYVGDFGQL